MKCPNGPAEPTIPQVLFDWYLATVIAGALHNAIAEDHISLLRDTAFVEDTDIDRKTRSAAIRAMRDHGIDDFRTVLGR